MALSSKNIRNIFIYALPKFAGYSLNLFTLPILTRILTPEDFGIITLAWAFPTIGAGIFTCGLASAAQRYYFEYRSDKKKLDALLFSSQAFLYLSLIVSATGVFFIKDYISMLTMGSYKYGHAIFVTYIAVYLGQVITFYLFQYQNMERAAVHSTFSILQSFITSAMSLLLVWHFKMSYMGMLYGSLTGACVTCISIMFHFNRKVGFIFNGVTLIENIKFGIQIVPKFFSSFINRFFDKYMLNNMVSLSAVGVYNIGQTVGNTMFFLMGTVWASFQPVCYREIFDNGIEGSASVGRLFTIFSYITLLPVLLLILFAQEIVYIVAPPSYYQAIDIIIILLGGIATQVFGTFAGLHYAYSKKVYWIFPITALGTVANVLANIVLIPRYGLIGAGFSSVISYAIMNGTVTYIGQKLYRIRYEWKHLVSMFAIITLAIISTLLLRNIEINTIYTYLIKLVIVVLFVIVGIEARLINRRSFERVFSSVLNHPERKGI